MFPDAPNGKVSKLFKDLWSNTKDRDIAKQIWGFAQTDLFKSEFGDLEMDENGEPTYEAIEQLLDLNSILKKSQVERNNAAAMGLTDNNGRPKKFDLYRIAQDLADRFNEKAKNTIAIVTKTDDGKYTTVVADKTPINIANADENKARAELNIALINLLRRIGFDVEFVNDPGYNGVFDPLLAPENADLLKKIIRVAKGEEGLDALPEEACHLILAGMQGHPLKARIDNMFTEDVVRSVLGDRYGYYKNLYKDGRTPLAERMRDEAEGKVLAAILKGEEPALSEPKILNINKNEYTDEFRRLQAESDRLSPEDIRRYHEQSISDEDKRRIGGILKRLLGTRSNGSGNDVWTGLKSDKYDTVFNLARVNGSLFKDVFGVARNYLKNGELVDLHDDYSDCKCFLSNDGLCGFAIEPDGNLVSVFSLNPSNKKGFLYAISDFVKEQGATHLDAYASKQQNLEMIYAKTLGFKVSGRMEFNPEYDEQDLIGTKHGNPDVVFMSSTNRDIKERYFSDYEAAQQNASKQASKKTVKGWLQSIKPLLLRLWNNAMSKFRKNISEEDVNAAVTNAANSLRPIADLIKSGEIEPLVDRKRVMEHEKLYDLDAKTERLLAEVESGEALLSKRLYILQHTRSSEDTKALRNTLNQVRKEIQDGKYTSAALSTLLSIGSDLKDITKEVNMMGFVYNNTTDLNLISSESALIKRLSTSIDAYTQYLEVIQGFPNLLKKGDIDITQEWADSLSNMATDYLKQIAIFKQDLGELRFQVLKQLITLYYGEMGEKPLDFKEADNAKWESIESILRGASEDISWWDTRAFSAGDSRNPLVNVLHKIVVSQQAKRNNRINKYTMKMQEAEARLHAAGYDNKFVYQLDEKGKPTGYYVGEVDMAKYEKARIEFAKNLDEQEGMDWYEKQRLIYEWEKENLREIEITMSDGTKLKERLPNPEIYGVSDFQKGWSQEQKDYYDALIDMKIEMDSYLPVAIRSMLTAPQVRKSVTQMFDKDGRGALKTIWGNWKKQFAITKDNTDYGNEVVAENRDDVKEVVTDFSNKPLKRVPIYFTHMLEDRSDLSTDATHAMFSYIAMAINFDEMSQLSDAMQLLQDHVNSDEFEVTQTEAGKPIVDAFRAAGRLFGREYKVGGKGTNISKAVEQYIDRNFFNETKKRLGKKKVFGITFDLDAIVNIFMKLTSSARIGLNPLSAITNATQGETQIIAECFSGKHFNFEDKAWSSKEYTKLLVDYLGNFNASDRHDLMYLLINQFNANEDYFRDMMDMDFNKSAYKRLLGRGNVYLLNTIGEHELHVRGMLMVLHHQKVKRLSDPDKTVSLYDVIKPVHDDNGWHLELDGDIEFVNKNQAFLQEFHFGDEVAIVKKTDRDKLFANLAIYINKLNADMHGGYSEAEKGNINQFAIARLVTQFRQWMFGMFNKMFSRSYFDAVMNVQREGAYISLFKFITGLIHDARTMTIKEAFLNSQLSETQKEGARVALGQVLMFIVLSIIASMTAGWKDDDDRSLRLLAYSIARLRLETGALVPWPPTFGENIFTLIQSPAAGVNTLKAIGDLLDITNYWQEVNSGRYQGWTVAAKTAWTLTPAYNIQKLIDMKDYNYMFNIFN